MHRLVPCLMVGATLVFAACDACGEQAPPSPAARARSTDAPRPPPPRPAPAQRLAARNLDRTKVYPKDEAGVTQCGAEVDCFLLASEGCAPASAELTFTPSLLVVQARVQAKYTIEGPGEHGCALRRDIAKIEIDFQPGLREMLRDQGKTDAEIHKALMETKRKVLERYPSHVACAFSGSSALEAMLDVADQRHDGPAWNKYCEPAQALPDAAATAAPAAQAEGKPAALTAAPAQPAKAGAEPAAAKAKGAQVPTATPKSP